MNGFFLCIYLDENVLLVVILENNNNTIFLISCLFINQLINTEIIHNIVTIFYSKRFNFEIFQFAKPIKFLI